MYVSYLLRKLTWPPYISFKDQYVSDPDIEGKVRPGMWSVTAQLSIQPKESTPLINLNKTFYFIRISSLIKPWVWLSSKRLW